MSHSSSSSAPESTNGILYVVATPIGNLADITERALTILKSADLILAEDTRRTLPLLQYHAVNGSNLQAFHEHNELRIQDKLIERLLSGENIAMVSDAGTPLISDPGYGLVAKAHEMNIKVEPIPGACAAIAALSASGMPTDKFFFVGFMPAKSAKRKADLLVLKEQVGTLVFYESSHRILASISDCLDVLGDRFAVMARELTKMHETIHASTLSELKEFVESDSNQQRGEFVLLIEGVNRKVELDEQEMDRVIKILLEDLPVKQASTMGAKILNVKKNLVYQRALELK